MTKNSLVRHVSLIFLISVFTAFTAHAADFSGNWTGTWTDGSLTGDLIATITQSGTTLSGKCTVTSPMPCSTLRDIPITGTVTGNTASFQGSTVCPVDNSTFESRYTNGVLSGNSLSGFYSIDVNGAFYDSGTYSMTRKLYFPHVDTSFPWKTEITIINTGDQLVTGTLRALSNAGQLVETKAVTLSARGRRQITVADEFTNHINIRYIIYEADSDTVQGYTKFYQTGVYRAAIPAVKEVNTSDIYISHIDSGTQWWTGVSLVNTTSTAQYLTITFNNGQSKLITLAANQHRAFDIAQEFFNNQPQPDIQSAVITNASGVIGLELFGNIGGSDHLDGILLTDDTTLTLYYPHVDSNGWWTGIVAYNPSASACTLTITPYSAQGTALTPSTRSLAGKEKYVGVVAQLGLPAQTAWFKIDATSPITGFELFGTADGNQLAAYAGGNGTGAKSGVFAKIEKAGWTGIAFVNTEAGAASVTLTAYNDSGSAVATQVLPVGGHAKVVNLAEQIFSPQDIGSATYIAYSSDRNVVGFQLNGTSDSMMLDGLPALGGVVTNPFRGSLSGAWQGTCPSGTPSGTFTMTIDSHGVTTGTYTGPESGTIIGNVSLSGSFYAVGTATASTAEGSITWSGNLSIIDGTVLSGNGSWLSPDCSGGWSGTGTLAP